MKLIIDDNNFIRLLKDRIDEADDSDIICAMAEGVLGSDHYTITYEDDKFVMNLQRSIPEDYGLTEEMLKQYNIRSIE